MMKKAISLGIVGLFVIGGLVGIFLVVPDEVEAPGPTYVSGLITTNTTWILANSPYIVVGDILVEDEYNLTIEPGVVVKFDADNYLRMDGTLHAVGNENQTILFTSNKSTPAPGDWGGIKISPTSIGSVIKYCTIEYGGGSEGGGLGNAADGFEISYSSFINNSASSYGGGIINWGEATIKNSIFKKNSADRGGGIRNEGTMIIENCTITENSAISAGGGIEAGSSTTIKNSIISENSAREGGGIANFGSTIIEFCSITGNTATDRGGGFYNYNPVIIKNCTITGNTANFGNGFYSDGGTTITVENCNLNNSDYIIYHWSASDAYMLNNWWGATNTDLINQSIYDFYDDFSLGIVHYMPFLTSPMNFGGSGLQPGSPWPMFRGNVRHTGLSPYDTSGNPGELKWSFTTNFRILSSPVIDSDGTIYITSGDDNLYAINANGTEKWIFTTGWDVHSSPAIGSDGTIYFISSDNKTYAVNPDGTEKWNFPMDRGGRSSPAIDSNGTIYVGSYDDKLYAIDPNGTEKWNFTTGDYVTSSPAIGSDGTIYVGSHDKKLYAINPDGTQKWNFPTGDLIESSPAIGIDDTIYIGSRDKKVYAIHPNGTQNWSFTTGSVIGSSPAIGSDGTIYIGSYDTKLYAINLDGTEKWNFTTAYEMESSPAIGSDGMIYVGSSDNKLYAINPNGTEKWSYMTGADVESSPAIGSDGTIYVGSRDSKLYAIGEAPQIPPPPAPSGPTSGEINTSYSFSTIATDPNGDMIKYGWDWDGDATVDEWSALVDSGVEDNRSHSWIIPGVYEIKVKVQDEFGHESNWSSLLNVTITTEIIDTDGDSIPDSEDPDDDNDGYLDIDDSFPLDKNEWYDTDSDGTGNNADTDDDGDTYLDVEDEFPLDPSEWLDTDSDGTGNNADTDDDNDGHDDVDDYFPLDPTRWSPLTEISIQAITVSNEAPVEGDEITITVVIENSDLADNNIIVKFYDGNPNSGGTQIGSDHQVTIMSDSPLTLTQNWIVVAGNHTIYVVIGHNQTTETISSSVPVEVSEELIPELVLSVGDLNMYRFEPGEERTIFVEVTCYYKTLENVHLVVLDDQNLTIDSTITPPRTMLKDETTKFYLRIKAPQLPEGKDKFEWDIKIQAVGDNGISSNSEELDIVVSQNAVSFFDPVLIAGAVATGSLATLGLAAAASRRNENWKYLLLLTFAVPLYTRIHGKKTLDNFVRGQVFGHIQSQPGTHFNEIKKTLKVGNGNLAYHIRKLEKEGFIKSNRDKRFRRFYPIGVEVPEENGIKLSKTQENILDYIERNPKSDQKDISKNVKESQQTISYNINVLMREGFLEEEKFKGTKRYEIMEDNN